MDPLNEQIRNAVKGINPTMLDLNEDQLVIYEQWAQDGYPEELLERFRKLSSELDLEGAGISVAYMIATYIRQL